MQRNSAFLIAMTFLTGCASLPEARAPATPTPAAPSAELIQAAQMSSYALSLQTAVHGSPTEQAEVMASARAGYDQARSGPAALRYGLLLAAPGHPARDASLAQRLLREALARPELLSPVERALGAVELSRVDTELRLSAEVERLIGELQQERERARATPPSNNAALTKRLQTEMEETARLRRLLDEARAKLEAITKIERNFSDRPPAPEGRTP